MKTVLQLIRVFVTGGYRPPRELNWLIGVAMLIFTLGANFMGYLLRGTNLLIGLSPSAGA